MKDIRKIGLTLFLLALAPWLSADPFPRPAVIEPAVNFWITVYSRVGTDGGLLHDRDDLSVVYEDLSFTENLWHPARERKIDQRRAHYQRVLRSLASGKRDNLSPEEARVLALWPDDVSNDRLRRAADNIRFQLGQADRFREGLRRAGAWKPYMYRTFDELGLPRELTALPHVESSFNPDAWSRIGAAGIWQFTRSTGRQYMQVDHVLDQRMDPFAATRAAGLLLRHNYSVTEDWGQAVTAYNHGLAGIRRAVRETGSEDIGEIIRTYDGRNWGFASRNFYPSFLAAVHVDSHAERYFGKLDTHAPLETRAVELPFYTPLSEVMAAFDIDRQALRELNRGLLDPVWSGNKYLPRGYRLRVPAHAVDDPEQALARISRERRYFAQVPDREHTVRPGEALSTIAARYNTSVRELMAMNNLRNAHLVRAGQSLRLPVNGEAEPIAEDTYRVQRGDTLSMIAYRSDMTLDALAVANGIDPSKPIHPGATLRVDGRPAEGVDTLAAVDVDAIADTPPEEAPAEASPDEPEINHGAGLADQLALLINSTARSHGRRPPLAAVRREAVTDQEMVTEEIPAASAPEDLDQALATDPSDYSVANDQSIEIQAAETLGHYAEWLDLRASDLRRVNNMRFRSPLVIGRRLTLVFSEVTPEQFEQRRRAYHRDIQAAFFAQHHIEDTRGYTIRKGDSLWSLTRPMTEVPVWLLRQYNPDTDFTALRPGDQIRMPVIQRHDTAPRETRQ